MLSISIIGMIILFILMIISVTLNIDSGNGYKSNWSRTIQIQDGKVISFSEIADSSSPSAVQQYEISEDGTYTLSLCMVPHGKTLSQAIQSDEKTGFVTLCVWKDPQGNLLSSDCGITFSTDKQLELKKGLYEIDFYDISDEETFLSYAKEYLCGTAFAQEFADIHDFASMPESGFWNMDYSFQVHREEPVSILFRVSILIYGILLSILIIILIIAVSTKGDSVKERYDERQRLEKGRAFGYAFFTTLVCLLLLSVLPVVDLSIPAAPSILYLTAGLSGVTVYAVYCIWHESYFALNQRLTPLMICFVLIGLSNLLIGIGNLLKGELIENGIITFYGSNLLIALMFLILFGTICLKKISSKYIHNAASEDEDEEE